MPTGQQIARHLRMTHRQPAANIVTGLEEHGSLDAYHAAEHADDPELGHEHDTAGDVVAESRTLENGKTVTRTETGWSLDGTAASIMTMFANVVENRPGSTVIRGDGTEVVVRLSLRDYREVLGSGATLIDAVRVLLGEGLVAIEDADMAEAVEDPDPTP